LGNEEINLLPERHLIKLNDLKIHETNVKEHPRQQVQDLAELIKLSGFKDPLVIDHNNKIFAGHGRLEAARMLKLEEVPCIYMEDMTEAQKKWFLLADNRINESPWVKDNVNIILDELGEFTFENFNMNFEDFNMKIDDEENEVPEIPENPLTKLGDIWELGDHRLLCGNCSDDLSELLGGKTIDCLVTDPPYNVDYSSKNELLNLYDKGNRVQTDILNDHITPEEYKKFTKEWFGNVMTQMSNYNSVYVFGNYETLLHLYEFPNFKISNMLVWVKNVQVLGRMDYQGKHEFIAYGWKIHHKWYGDRSQNTVFEYDKPRKSELHPTMKPIELIQNILKNSSQPKQLIFDSFLGSGTTLIACEQLNRSCYGCELSPAYCDVIVTRWENLTGRKAIKLTTVAPTVITPEGD
jgi:site-specific DNA-methyltransferase (adenine-specific)